MPTNSHAFLPRSFGKEVLERELPPKQESVVRVRASGLQHALLRAYLAHIGARANTTRGGLAVECFTRLIADKPDVLHASCLAVEASMHAGGTDAAAAAAAAAESHLAVESQLDDAAEQQAPAASTTAAPAAPAAAAAASKTSAAAEGGGADPALAKDWRDALASLGPCGKTN
jgi:hypothetical protein